ncbi:hypothetical protein [Klebsiella variicola]|uniref:hypothetical protein n=1 Tax=Klebsiella variicola TaxID=244366 RepID=UPI00214EB458|nr:hypothetical protein [Klebsiella variicola]MCR3913036.1 hypothetical protein [Klebsiella variicola]
MTTDITELAQSLKRRAASANEFGECLYVKADDILALAEALEKAQTENGLARGQLLIAHRTLLNQQQSIADLVTGRQDLQQTMGVYVHAYEEAKEQVAKDVEIKARLCRESNSLFDRLRVAEKRIAELESRTVKLPDDEDGQAYGFGKWANGKLPATAGTMTITYCEDAWRAAFEVFSSAAGIKVEAE